MKKEEIIKLLERERDFEDELAIELHNTYLSHLDEIEDLTTKEKEEIKEKITKLKKETEGHKIAFDKMIEYIKNGTNKN